MDKNDYIKLEGKIQDGYDNNCNPVTIIQIEGDPFNIMDTYGDPIDVRLYIPKSAIQPASDKETAKRKWAISGDPHTLRVATCEGPECRKFAGTNYDKCPHASKKI